MWQVPLPLGGTNARWVVSTKGHKWVRFASPQLAPTVPATKAFIALRYIGLLIDPSFHLGLHAAHTKCIGTGQRRGPFLFVLPYSWYVVACWARAVQTYEMVNHPFATMFGMFGPFLY